MTSSAPKVFIDSSVLVAAVGSPSGGSARVLRLAKGDKIKLCVTLEVLRETRLNIAEKFSREKLVRFLMEVKFAKIKIVPEPTEKEISRWEPLTVPKDTHVLAGAIKAKADVLVSLDKQHILTTKVKKNFPILVQNTKQFLAAFPKTS